MARAAALTWAGIRPSVSGGRIVNKPHRYGNLRSLRTITCDCFLATECLPNRVPSNLFGRHRLLS